MEKTVYTFVNGMTGKEFIRTVDKIRRDYYIEYYKQRGWKLRQEGTTYYVNQ